MNVFLEGYSFVGKTTLLNALAKVNASLKIIDEHDLYAKGINNYPSFPSPTYDDAVANVNFFYNLEQQRHLDSRDAILPVFDRSVFSTILFQKYVSSLALDGYASAYEYAKDEAIRLIDSGSITIPDALVCVKADYTTVVERYGREVSVGLLRGEGAYGFFKEQYRIVEAIYAQYGMLQTIISTNDIRTVDEQAQSINSQIYEWNGRDRHGFDSRTIAKEVVRAL